MDETPVGDDPFAEFLEGRVSGELAGYGHLAGIFGQLGFFFGHALDGRFCLFVCNWSWRELLVCVCLG